MGAVAGRLAATPYARLLGLRLEAASDDAVRLRLPYRDTLANRNRTVHGGVTASLIDVAGALTAVTEAAPPGRTLDLSVRYLAPALGADLIGDARLVRRGAAITVVEVEVRTDDGTIVATGLTTVRAAEGPGARLDRPEPALVPRSALDRPVPSGSPFTRQLGVAVAWFAPGTAIALLRSRPDLADADGRVHEGVLAALSDSVSGGASWSLSGSDLLGRAGTLGMHLSFHAPALGEDVIAEGHVVGHDERVFQCSVTMRGRTSGATVASGWVTYRIVPGEG